jgi:hypothetical protein
LNQGPDTDVVVLRDVTEGDGYIFDDLDVCVCVSQNVNIDVAQDDIDTSTDAGGPIKLSEPAYRVIAALERPDIDAYGKKVLLQPDMLLKADIILERRSLMSWLTNPLVSVRM